MPPIKLPLYMVGLLTVAGTFLNSPINAEIIDFEYSNTVEIIPPKPPKLKIFRHFEDRYCYCYGSFYVPVKLTEIKKVTEKTIVEIYKHDYPTTNIAHITAGFKINTPISVITRNYVIKYSINVSVFLEKNKLYSEESFLTKLCPSVSLGSYMMRLSGIDNDLNTKYFLSNYSSKYLKIKRLNFELYFADGDYYFHNNYSRHNTVKGNLIGDKLEVYYIQKLVKTPKGDLFVYTPRLDYLNLLENSDSISQNNILRNYTVTIEAKNSQKLNLISKNNNVLLNSKDLIIISPKHLEPIEILVN